MKAEEIRDWDEVEIEARLKELREEKFKLRFQLSMMELENPNLFRQVRRDIARLETVKKERELAVAESNHIPEGS
ncbi:MAG: 50S ribosomal protein L29 [Gemmatimonadota bacterium]|jgi:large subunit ribosomal protein L29|nr:50S ribosomal protein L29 [Gemmatimonadota bacterium]|tara:strand:- start:472 stop:696 length:225 start_codon:yes stop_codon:yes gene_type:complete